MKRLEYRCEKCMIIEERWYINSHKPTSGVTCHLCGGVASKIPLSNSNETIAQEGFIYGSENPEIGKTPH